MRIIFQVEQHRTEALRVHELPPMVTGHHQMGVLLINSKSYTRFAGRIIVFGKDASLDGCSSGMAACKERKMKKLAFIGFLSATAMSASAQAQITFDMSRVSCAAYTAMDPATSRDFSAWMSGWFNQQAGSSTLNVEGYRRNVANVQRWCASNPKRLVMAGLKNAAANARPGQPGPTDIDGSLITCGQLLAADADMQDLIASWMSGWFMSTKNLTSVDVRYVERNSRVVRQACQRNRNQKLMAVIQENFR